MSTKVTYFITSLNFGGAEIGMTRLIDGIKESGLSGEFDITVISLVKAPRDVVGLLPNSVTVRHLDVEKPYEIWKIRQLWDELKDTDILVCSLYHASILGVPLASVQRVSQILTWQHNSEYRSQTARTLYGFCYRLSDNILADSKAVKKMLITEFSLSRSKVSVLPIAGVDTQLFSPDSDMVDFRNDHPIQIGTVGRLAHQKGYDYVLECANRIANAQFHIIGEGELEEELKSTVNERNIGNISFHGKLPYEMLPKYLASFDIYFQPSRYEGLCMTVIEAMSAGLPIVASNVGGIRESVNNKETGFLVEPGDIEEYSTGLQKLIENPELRDQFGESGRQRVAKLYSKEILVEEFYNLIN